MVFILNMKPAKKILSLQTRKAFKIEDQIEDQRKKHTGWRT